MRPFERLTGFVTWLARPLQRALDRRQYRADVKLARELYLSGHPMLAELVLNGGRFSRYRHPPFLDDPPVGLQQLPGLTNEP